MKKTNFLILLVIISLTSCSREEEKNIVKQLKQDNQSAYSFVKLSQKDDSVAKKLMIDGYAEEVYNHIDKKYKYYIESSDVDYQKYNKNGEHLIFPFHNLNEIVDDQHIVIFKYYDNILITFYDYNITNDYYIDLKNMYYFVSLEENEKIKELFEKTPIEYRCKVSKNDDYTIKFYDENCEKRIKEMLKMVSANKVHEEKNINDIENKVYKTIEDKYGYYLDGGTLNLKEFNKNGIFLIFEMSLDYDRTMNKYLKIFKYKNDIFINRMNVKDNIFYIDMIEMQFLPDIEHDQVANDIANRGKTGMFCKISIQEDNKIKFYDKTCEKRIKEMLKMDFQK